MNHALADTFNGKTPCPQWPNGLTYQKLGKTDVNGPKVTSASAAMRYHLKMNLNTEKLCTPVQK